MTAFAVNAAAALIATLTMFGLAWIGQRLCAAGPKLMRAAGLMRTTRR